MLNVHTINCKSSVEEVFCSSDYSTDYRQSPATIFVLLIGFAQQLRLQISVILTPSAEGISPVKFVKDNKKIQKYLKMLTCSRGSEESDLGSGWSRCYLSCRC